jgi:hypothetical protein
MQITNKLTAIIDELMANQRAPRVTVLTGKIQQYNRNRDYNRVR